MFSRTKVGLHTPGIADFHWTDSDSDGRSVSAMNIYFQLQVDGQEDITRQQVSRALLRQMTRCFSRLFL